MTIRYMKGLYAALWLKGVPKTRQTWKGVPPQG